MSDQELPKIYHDHGKKVDRHGQLIIETDYRHELVTYIMNYKTHAIVMILAIILENVCRIYARNTVSNWLHAAIGSRQIYKLWKSDKDQRRDVVISMGYLVSSYVYFKFKYLIVLSKHLITESV